MTAYSPIGARRMKTDLQTSELKNVFFDQRTSKCNNCVINADNQKIVTNNHKKSFNSSPVLNNKRKTSVTNVATNTSPQKIRSF